MMICIFLFFAAVAIGGGGDEGYLFVSNRADEVVFAARRLRQVSPGANITLVSDDTTIEDVEAPEVFDVIVRTESAMPDIGPRDAMGFRLQKLRGMTVTPYARTIYMDSDTFACQPFPELFDFLRRVDVACAHGGRGNHSGASAGVLAYANTPASRALWAAWERTYREIMATSRREQPSFQRALALATASHGLRVAKLALSYNCRNVRDCAPAILKDGSRTRCAIIHAHDFAPEVERLRNGAAVVAAKAAKYAARCPLLSGGYRLVVLLEPPGASHQTAQALASLKLANDFALCDLRSEPRPEASLRRCVATSNKYAVVAVGNFPHVDLVENAVAVAVARHPLARLDDALVDETLVDENRALENLRPNADVLWFCGGTPACEDALRRDPEAALTMARDAIASKFLAVGASERLTASAAELERALPSHFLRLANHLSRRRHRRRHDVTTSTELAFLRANHLDLQLYDFVVDRLETRRRNCLGGEEEEEGTPPTTTVMPLRHSRRRRPTLVDHSPLPRHRPSKISR